MLKQAYDCFAYLKIANNSSINLSVCSGKYFCKIPTVELKFIWNMFLQPKRYVLANNRYQMNGSVILFNCGVFHFII